MKSYSNELPSIDKEWKKVFRNQYIIMSLLVANMVTIFIMM